MTENKVYLPIRELVLAAAVTVSGVSLAKLNQNSDVLFTVLPKGSTALGIAEDNLNKAESSLTYHPSTSIEIAKVDGFSMFYNIPPVYPNSTDAIERLLSAERFMNEHPDIYQQIHLTVLQLPDQKRVEFLDDVPVDVNSFGSQRTSIREIRSLIRSKRNTPEYKAGQKQSEEIVLSLLALISSIIPGTYAACGIVDSLRRKIASS